MKRILSVLLAMLLGLSVLIPAGAATKGSRSEVINTRTGEITDEELRTFFNENQVLLNSIATQIIPLLKEIDLYRIYRSADAQIKVTDSGAENIASALLGASLLRRCEQYFNLIGSANSPTIEVQEAYAEGVLIVSFKFNLDLSTGHNKCIQYSPNYQSENWIYLDTDWYILEWIMDGPPIVTIPGLPLKWWERVPAWLQWVLRWVCFGWLWMK